MHSQPMPLRAAAGFGVFEPEPQAQPRPNDHQQALAVIARLRDHIARMESHAPKLNAGRNIRYRPEKWLLGVDAIDRNLPASGLARASLHDIAPAAYGDFPAASGFALGLALRHMQDETERRPLLWCRLESEVREYGKPYGHGLEVFGLARQRFLTVTLKKPAALFWTMEEALKSGVLAVVIADAAPRHADLTTTRRLSLAAEAGKSAGLLVFTKLHDGPTASTSRWRVKTERSHAPPFDESAPGPPCWTIELTRARSGRPGFWTVNWQKHHATHHFTLAHGFSGGTFSAQPPQRPQTHAVPRPALRAG
jgi:protein ImuA